MKYRALRLARAVLGRDTVHDHRCDSDACHPDCLILRARKEGR